MRQFPDDENGRRDRGWTRRADRGALAPLARIRTDDLRAGTEAGRPVDGTRWPERRLAGHAHEHQSHHDCLQRPGEQERPCLPIKPRDPELLASLCRHVRPYVAHPVRHSCRTPQARRCRMARRSRGPRGKVRTSGRGEWQIPCPRHPPCARAGHVRRLGRSDLHLPLQRARSISGQAGSRGRLRYQRPRGRRRTRPARRSTRCRNPAPTEVRPTEIRRRSPVRSPDLHAIRNPRERDSPSSRDRPAAEGESWSRLEEVRSSTAHPRPTRRFSPPGSPSTSSTYRSWPRDELRCAPG